MEVGIKPCCRDDGEPFGKPSLDKEHPDYVPNVFVFTKQKNTAKIYERRKKTIEKRAKILQQKEKSSEVESAADALMLLAQSHESEDHMEVEEVEEHHVGTNETPAFPVNQSDDMRKIAAETMMLLAQGRQCDEITEPDRYVLPDLVEGHQSDEMRETVAEVLPISLEAHQMEDRVQHGASENEEDSIIISRKDLSELEALMPKLKLYEEVLKIVSAENTELKKKVLSLNTETKFLRQERDNLRRKSVYLQPTDRILNTPFLLKLYTGLPSVTHFHWIISLLKDNIQVTSISRETQLLIVLMKLKLNLLLGDLAFRFDVSKTTVSKLMDKWIPLLAAKFETCISWPTKKALKKNIPKCFKRTPYKNAVCIIDCTEVPIQKPSSLLAQSQLYSNYKSTLTAKFFVASTPSGAVCFVSGAYGGRATDKEIAIDSGFLEKLSPGDQVLADRGFYLGEYFAEKEARLVVPCYIRGKKQLTKQEVLYSKKIANVRIHIERIIKQIKRFQILQGKLTITFLKHINNIIIICAALSNLTKSVVP